MDDDAVSQSRKARGRQSEEIVADFLRRSGFLVSGVRPPTVPPGTSRLRVSLSAAHPPELVEALAATLLAALPPPR